MKTKITRQEAYELRRFLENLAAGRITTLELKSVLMVLRQHCDGNSALFEWTNSVAHKKRDRGMTFDAGTALWIEKFELETFFRGTPPEFEKNSDSDL